MSIKNRIFQRSGELKSGDDRMLEPGNMLADFGEG